MTDRTLNDTRTIVSIRNGGAGRGAELMLPAIREYNAQSKRFCIRPFYIDPVPQRAQLLAERAGRLGVQAESAEGRIEDFVRQRNGQPPAALILNLDRPAAIARALGAAVESRAPVLAYMILRMPDEELFGIRMAFQAHEDHQKALAMHFFECLAEVAARSGAGYILGERGRPNHIAAEPLYRAWFGDHMGRNITKLVAGLEPESSPFELTSDGSTTLGLAIRNHRTGWVNPRDLAVEIAAKPPSPLIRGEDSVVVETGPDGLRFHRVRLRLTDGKAALWGSAIVDPATIRESAERERLQREAELAIERAKRHTISLARPAFTTD